MRPFTLILFFSLSTVGFMQGQSLIPQPVEMHHGNPAEHFSLSAQTLIHAQDPRTLNSLNFLHQYLQQHYKWSLPHTQQDEKSGENQIRLLLDPNLNEHPHQYRLTVDRKSITITATSDTGLFYGIQTLIQLIPPQKSHVLSIPSVHINDYPRFGYRGMHLDVSRHFFDVAFIKKYIDYLALYKLNYFHWHLTDDHGWRIEIKKYPLLTTIGAWRDGTIIGLYPGKGNDGKRYGGYYTQEEIKEVIAYAAARYITIIPEIEMPAHSMAVLAAYPQYGTEPTKKSKVAETWGMFNKFNNVLQPKEATFSFLQEVLTEVMDLFPSPYIHIGGDEASKIWWKQSAESQRIMKEKGLKDENALQSYFIHRIEAFVNSKGKTIIGWDEILDGGLAPNAIVMSWRGEKGGIAAAKAGHKVIMTPENNLYFNHAQFMKDDSLTAAKYLPLQTVYQYEPVPDELSEPERPYIWGAQANLWSEYISNPAKAAYMLFPRIAALSEITWTPKPKRNYTDFLKRLENQFRLYDLWGVTYSKRYER